MVFNRLYTAITKGLHGLGGRLGTRIIEPQGLIFDHAARFFTASDSRFVRYVDEWLAKGLVREWNGVVGELEVGGSFSQFPSSSSAPRYIAVNGMRSLADSLLLKVRDPKPVYTRLQLWGAALRKNTPAVPCIFDPQGRAGMCGDWLLGSNVESAALSAEALGNHIADFLQKGEANPEEFAIGLQDKCGKIALAFKRRDFNGTLHLRVLEDANNQVWSKFSVVIPSWGDLVGGYSFLFKGALITGELIFATASSINPFYFICYIVKENNAKRVVIEGIVHNLAEVEVFFDHGDSLMFLSKVYQVFTLGGKEKEWRRIECKHPHHTPYESEGICMNGVVYYYAWTNGEGCLISFDMSSEEFNAIMLPEDDWLLDFPYAVNYSGKIALMMYGDYYGTLDFWVLEDASKQELSKVSVVLPSWRQLTFNRDTQILLRVCT